MIKYVVRRRQYKCSVQINGNCVIHLKYVNFCMEITRIVLKSSVINSLFRSTFVKANGHLPYPIRVG